MKHVYYFIGIFFIIYELGWMAAPIEKANESLKFKELHNKYKKYDWDAYPKPYKDLVKKKLWLVVLYLWLLIGLFTFQWAAFLTLLLFQFIIITPLSKASEYTPVYTILHWFNSVVGFAFGVFVIINSYHLKIDITAWMCRLFNQG